MSLEATAPDGADLVPFIGERAVSLLAFAVADAAGSPTWEPYFRGLLVDRGEDPESPQVTEAEQLLIDWGRMLASGAESVPADFSSRVEKTFSVATRRAVLEFAERVLAAGTDLPNGDSGR